MFSEPVARALAFGGAYAVVFGIGAVLHAWAIPVVFVLMVVVWVISDRAMARLRQRTIAKGSGARFVSGSSRSPDSRRKPFRGQGDSGSNLASLYGRLRVFAP